VFVTVDRNLKHQQPPTNLPIPVLVLVAQTNRLADLIPLVPMLEQALSGPLTKSVTEFASDSP